MRGLSRLTNQLRLTSTFISFVEDALGIASPRRESLVSDFVLLKSSLLGDPASLVVVRSLSAPGDVLRAAILDEPPNEMPFYSV